MLWMTVCHYYSLRPGYHLNGLLVSVLGWLAIILPMSQLVPGVVVVGEMGVSVVDMAPP